MTEPTPNTPTPDSGGQSSGEQGVTPEQPPAPTAEDITRLQAALDKERDARKAAEKAAKDFQQQQRASMDDTQRALLEAEERGAAAVRAEYGARLAQTQFEADAARRNPGYDVGKALKYVNVAAFVGDDGTVDGKAIAAAVADLVPEASTGPRFGDADQGPRNPSNSGPDMSALIRQAAGRG